MRKIFYFGIKGDKRHSKLLQKFGEKPKTVNPNALSVKTLSVG
jgi:hypothetical protein